MNTKIISAICITLAICLAIYFYAEWQKAKFDASLPAPPPVAEQTGGHWHDGEWHADGTHADEKLIPSVDWEPNTGRPHEAAKPEGLDELDADDPVAKAWAKLDEIADNPFAWGGNADPRTEGLVQQLMPPPVELAPEGSPEDNSEELIGLLVQLIDLRDPRAIETFVAYQCESPIGGSDIREALVALGPPVVPYLIPYLDNAEYRGLYTAAYVLSHIGAQHRADLGGIVEYIILPKLEQILAEEDLNPFRERRVQWAVTRLKR